MNQKICITSKQSFKTYCQLNNLTVSKIPGDGHCLINASLMSYFGDLYHYEKAIHKIHQELCTNFDEWLPFTPYKLNIQTYNKKINEYLKSGKVLCAI